MEGGDSDGPSAREGARCGQLCRVLGADRRGPSEALCLQGPHTAAPVRVRGLLSGPRRFTITLVFYGIVLFIKIVILFKNH